MASAALLAGFWVFWPGPAEIAGDPSSYGDASLAAPTRASTGGLLTETSVAVSAKRQLMAGAVAARNPFEETSRRIAAALPLVGPGGEPSAGLASSEVRNTTANLPVKTAPESGGGRVGFVHSAIAAVTPGPASSGGRPDGTTVAHLEAPAALVPGRALRGLPLWLRNAVASPIDDRPAIAIVIDDLGMSRKRTTAVNQLKSPLTLAFLPYAPNLSEQTRAARAAGHELMLHVPMEPAGDVWPGGRPPNALLGSLEPHDLISRLRGHLRSFRGFVGINNHMGSLLTSDSERMSLVMAELRRHGLLFLDSRTGDQSVAAREARRLHVPYAERDVFLDNEFDFNAVLRQLARTERIARRWGQAVAIGHPRDATIEALRRWLPTLDARGFALVPISAIVARRSCAERVLAMAEACASYAAAVSQVQ